MKCLYVFPVTDVDITFLRRNGYRNSLFLPASPPLSFSLPLVRVPPNRRGEEDPLGAECTNLYQIAEDDGRRRAGRSEGAFVTSFTRSDAGSNGSDGAIERNCARRTRRDGKLYNANPAATTWTASLLCVARGGSC